MGQPLTALIHGAGFAGQGHAMALRACGVEVTGMVSRTAEVVADVAQRLDIGHAATDWEAALAQLRPEIVAIGTPGGAHVAPITAALERGCHVLCDKPLTTDAPSARGLYELAATRRVKTAFAASYWYQPHALLARQLVADGAIGEPQEVECISHYDLNPLIPWGWSHRIDLGGGRLSNNFTHKLAIVLHVLDGAVRRVNGSVRNDLHRAPVVEGVHDFRERESYAPAAEELDAVQWREVDSEWSYTMLAEVDAGARGAPQRRASGDPVSALFRHGGIQPRFHGDGVGFYGSEAAIHIEGAYAQGPLHLKRRGCNWEQIPVPATITGALPPIDNDTQRNWTQLARELVADIRGEGSSGFLTFRDGWLFQEIIDAARRGNGWFELPADDVG